ncbi:hypothetical protein B0H66DRAFT_334521 [Apodospora peruviana]|uniref:Uncharacterized protein n=1 Tax=Apodospora peruviana TaxID=516989 RepID=A0AAE0M103_9PEZI|nr:hypothetical protein B0H66DRAFT_334521 [Apodospora peruviana]
MLILFSTSKSRIFSVNPALSRDRLKSLPLSPGLSRKSGAVGNSSECYAASHGMDSSSPVWQPSRNFTRLTLHKNGASKSLGETATIAPLGTVTPPSLQLVGTLPSVRHLSTVLVGFDMPRQQQRTMIMQGGSATTNLCLFYSICINRATFTLAAHTSNGNCNRSRFDLATDNTPLDFGTCPSKSCLYVASELDSNATLPNTTNQTGGSVASQQIDAFSISPSSVNSFHGSYTYAEPCLDLGCV